MHKNTSYKSMLNLGILSFDYGNNKWTNVVKAFETDKIA